VAVQQRLSVKRYEAIAYLFGIIPVHWAGRFQCNPHNIAGEERFYQSGLKPWARRFFKMKCREVKQ